MLKALYCIAASDATARIPRPPPPWDALSITGKPMSRAAAAAAYTFANRGQSDTH